MLYMQCTVHLHHVLLRMDYFSVFTIPQAFCFHQASRKSLMSNTDCLVMQMQTWSYMMLPKALRQSQSHWPRTVRSSRVSYLSFPIGTHQAAWACCVSAHTRRFVCVSCQPQPAAMCLAGDPGMWRPWKHRVDTRMSHLRVPLPPPAGIFRDPVPPHADMLRVRQAWLLQTLWWA